MFKLLWLNTTCCPCIDNDADTIWACICACIIAIAPEIINDSLNGSEAVNIVVPLTVRSPLITTEPDVRNEPVNWCRSSDVSPNLVEPDEYKTEDVT